MKSYQLLYTCALSLVFLTNFITQARWFWESSPASLIDNLADNNNFEKMYRYFGEDAHDPFEKEAIIQLLYEKKNELRAYQPVYGISAVLISLFLSFGTYHTVDWVTHHQRQVTLGLTTVSFPAYCIAIFFGAQRLSTHHTQLVRIQHLLEFIEKPITRYRILKKSLNSH
jgi:hypothetical protein